MRGFWCIKFDGLLIGFVGVEGMMVFGVGLLVKLLEVCVIMILCEGLLDGRYF